MTKRTYWIMFPRNFANEYDIGVATTEAAAENYRAEGYERITRERALRELTDRGDDATQVYVGALVDGEPEDRFCLAGDLRGAA